MEGYGRLLKVYGRLWKVMEGLLWKLSFSQTNILDYFKRDFSLKDNNFLLVLVVEGGSGQ